MKKLLRKYLPVIDRYIIGKYLGTFTFTLMIFIVITVVFDISEHIDNFLQSGRSVSEIATEYYGGFIPFYMNMLSPLINFLAVIFFTAKMANQTEIVPILTSKASFNRFLRPYFISATIVFIVSFYANVYLIPYTNRLKITFENENGFNGNDDPTRSEVHMQISKNTYVYLQNFDKTINTGYTFVLEKFDGDQLREKLTSDRIVYDSLKKKWSIMNPDIRYVNGLKESLVQRGMQKDTALDMHPTDFIKIDNEYTAMPLHEINATIEKEKLRRPEVLPSIYYEKYRRFVYPLSTYVLTLIGVALSSRKVRGGVGLPLGIGIFLCFAYIVVDKFATVFAIQGGVPALIAVFIPNVLFGLLGYYLLVKAPK
ncbi:YjgP/YjgQ family permease [Mucilaginibacter limnophilus]|uniref:YjgP/YjgQ family permease n=1 Tax=Mucilaginibacter limnophilus TaxID=1932778 RepID=A0A437MKB4_9SPHI|nr:LptF/LptG family permease [Mucilaginibacter limnophilus]RVT98090.1 YjgP/YjgQ family permease [Mucilaginibacter limnophilus]